MSHETHSFKTGRRSRRANKQDPIHAKDIQAWTAARCQRLLRPIISRIELLKKDPAQYTYADETSHCHQARTEAVKVLDSSTSAETFGTQDEDVYWGQARKRLRKTYTTRGKLRTDLGEELASKTFPKEQQKPQERTAALL